MKKIAILGGGISGLVAAWRLFPYHQITLFEKNANVGGLIQTIEKEGFLFERGPRGFRPRGKGKCTLQLVQELGLQNELIVSKAKERYLFLNGKLNRVDPLFLLQIGFFKACFKELRMKSFSKNESIGEFFERRFGKKITNTLIDPLVTGIFGGSLWDLCIGATWPHLLDFEKKYGSIVKGYLKEKKEKGPLLLSFKKGMQTLPKRLYELLEKKINFQFEKAVTKIQWMKNQIFINDEEFDFCISTLPTWCLEPFLSVPHIAYVPMITINFGWHKKLALKKGFGYLIPSSAKESILGVTFDSQIFDSQGTKVCVMMREGTVQEALSSLQKHLGIKDKPDVMDAYLIPKAIPQYQKGHTKRLQELKFPLMAFIGNYREGVGINDCLAQGLSMDESILF